MFAYPRIAERLFGRAHAIEPNALRAIMEGPAVRRILSGEAKHDPDTTLKARAQRRARLAAAVDGETVVIDDGCEYVLTRDGIAIVPVFGVLAQRFDFIAEVCGWATYEGIIKTCDAMLNDYRVSGILFNIESPGGEVSGMFDAAEAIIRLGQAKPVWSIANAYAYSAAYAIAGSAETVCIPRMADVGSIGAVMIHVDESTADDLEGMKYSAIYSGARKIDGWGHAPISDGAMAVFQERVDYVRQEFASLVGRQGRISADAAMATEAALYTDFAAVKAGLADRVANFDEALSQLTELATGIPRDSKVAARSVALTPTKETLVMASPKTAAQVAQEVENQTKIDAAVAEKLTAAKAEGKAEAQAEIEAANKAATEAAALAAAAKSADEPKPEADAYTPAMASQVTELCALAGVSAAAAKKFIDTKTAPDLVKATLLKDRADKAKADVALNPTQTQSPSANVDKMWAESVERTNKLFGIAPPK